MRVSSKAKWMVFKGWKCSNVFGCSFDRVDKYTVVTQSFLWPSNERMEHSAKYNKEYRKCCSIVSLRFWSAEQTTLKYEPKYQVLIRTLLHFIVIKSQLITNVFWAKFVEFISYFGGLLSIWLGFSLVKIYDVFEVIVKKIFKRCRSDQRMEALNIFKRKSTNKQRTNRPRVAKYYKTKHMHASIWMTIYMTYACILQMTSLN